MMADRSGVELVRRLIEAFARGDLPTIEKALSVDIQWHDSGRSRVMGDKNGRKEVVQHLARLGELSNGTFAVDLHAVLGDDEHVVGLLTMRGERNGRTLRDKLVTVWHVRDGQVTDFWSTALDQYRADEFWS